MLRDHNLLECILNNIKKIDSRLLNLLLYSHKVEMSNNEKYINSPIFMACGGHEGQGNFKSTDIVLKYMSELEYKNPFEFSGLFSQLISLKSF